MRTRQSLYRHLLGIFLVIVSVFWGIGVWIFNWGVHTIRQEFIADACIQNRNFTDTLDRELKRIITLQYELADNWDLLRLSTPLASSYSSYDKSRMVLRIQEKLNAIQTSSRFVDEIQAVIPQASQTIGTISAGSLSETDLHLLENHPTIGHRQFQFHNNELLLVAEYPPMYYARGLEPYYLIYASVSQRQILSFLNEMNFYKQGESFLMSESREMVIGSGSEELAQAIRQEIFDGSVSSPAQLDGSAVPDTYTLFPKINGKKYIVIYTNTGRQDLSLVHYISEEEAFSGLISFKLLVLLFGISTMVLVFLFGRSLYLAIHSPLSKLVSAFKQLQGGDFSAKIQDQRTDEFQYIYDGFNEMVQRLDSLIGQVYKQKILVERAKFKQLQSQINPHFLYNSFLILSNRIELGDNEFASDFCRELGSYFLFITSSP